MKAREFSRMSTEISCTLLPEILENWPTDPTTRFWTCKGGFLEKVENFVRTNRVPCTYKHPTCTNKILARTSCTYKNPIARTTTPHADENTCTYKCTLQPKFVRTNTWQYVQSNNPRNTGTYKKSFVRTKFEDGSQLSFVSFYPDRLQHDFAKKSTLSFEKKAFASRSLFHFGLKRCCHQSKENNGTYWCFSSYDLPYPEAFDTTPSTNSTSTSVGWFKWVSVCEKALVENNK